MLSPSPPQTGASALGVLERRLASLGLLEAHPARADGGIQLVLRLIHFPCPLDRLRPEVARVGRVAAELEADQMVLLVVGGGAAAPIRLHLLDLELARVARWRPDRPRPALTTDRLADRGLRNAGVRDARGQRPVRALRG